MGSTTSAGAATSSGSEEQETYRYGFGGSAVREWASGFGIGVAYNRAGIELTPPAVFTGRDIKVDFLNIPTLALSMISEIGVMEINIAFTEE